MEVKRAVSKEYYEGCLLGSAIGDTLGAPVEGLDKKSIQNYHGQVTDFLPCIYPSGSYTDDTQQTILVAESLVANKGILNPEDLAQRFVRYYDSNEYRAIGDTFRAAVERLKEGYSWKESGLQEPENGKLPLGCGSAMRVAPVGLLYNTKEELLDNAVNSSLPTHAHPETLAGAAIVAYCVSYVKSRNSQDINFDHLLPEIQNIASRLKAERMYKRLDLLRRNKFTADTLEQLGTTGDVMSSVTSALACFMLYPSNYEATVIEAVNLGGDTDSRAAMAGAISGAYNGVNAIPTRWLHDLENREGIRELAEELYELRR